MLLSLGRVITVEMSHLASPHPLQKLPIVLVCLLLHKLVIRVIQANGEHPKPYGNENSNDTLARIGRANTADETRQVDQRQNERERVEKKSNRLRESIRPPRG